MGGITDIHCHILPGVDDGAQNLEETMETLRLAASQGIRKVIATSHYHPGRYMVKAESILASIALVQEKCIEENIEIELYSGHEIFYHNEVRELLKTGELLTLADSRYVLIEFDISVDYQYLLNALKDIRYGGYRPILAHFERYNCLKKDYRLEELKDMGVFLQMNFDTLLKKNSLFHKLPWMGYVKEGLVDFLGSDTHGMHFRPLHVDQVLNKLEKQVDEEIIYKMLQVNPMMIIDGN